MNSVNVQQWIQQNIANMLEVDISAVDADTPLETFGLGSKDATELVAGLETWLRVKLPATLLYEHENISSLSAFVAAQAMSRTQ